MKSFLNKLYNIFKKRRYAVFTILIMCIGYVLRSFNLNWDSGFHMHPDERAIVMFALDLSFPKSIGEFFSPQSPLNPHFFAYGNFPLYLLRLLGSIFSVFNPQFAEYSQIQIIGRFLGTIIDSLSILLTFFLSGILFNKRVGIIASFLYATAVLPIQLSHFYTVDILLSFFLLCTMTFCIKLLLKNQTKYAFSVGVFFGLAIATKFSAVIFLLPIMLSLTLLIIKEHIHKNKTRIKSAFNTFVVKEFLIIIGISVITSIVLQPYSLIDYQSFIFGIQEQSKMTKDAYTFPYTLQYVGKIPIWHEFKNLLFGFGPLQTLFALFGFILVLINTKKIRTEKRYAIWVVASFVAVYFVIVSSFAVGWMRYMLPLYSYLSIFAAYSIYKLINNNERKGSNLFFLISVVLLIILFLLWPISFMHIYMKENTRVQATDWILKNIPSGSVLAVEHWDDRIPIVEGEKYRFEELTLYDYPDSESKWKILEQKIERSDYIVIASNRLYTPLMKISDCQKFDRCYIKTSEYYKNLFNNNLGFKKVAEFSEYPKIPFTNIRINDQLADESFTVYDHPKVIIYKKIDIYGNK